MADRPPRSMRMLKEAAGTQPFSIEYDRDGGLVCADVGHGCGGAPCMAVARKRKAETELPRAAAAEPVEDAVDRGSSVRPARPHPPSHRPHSVLSVRVPQCVHSVLCTGMCRRVLELELRSTSPPSRRPRPSLKKAASTGRLAI